MARNQLLPRAQGSIAGNLPPTPEYRQFFEQLAQSVIDAGGTSADVAELSARIAALEAAGTISFTNLASVQVFGDAPNFLISLVGDTSSPPARFVYGTDANGFKTWTPVLVENLTGSTYSTLQHFVNTMHSPGIITGGDLSQLDADTVRVSAGTGMVRVLDDDVSSLVFFDFPQQDFDIPADQDTRYYAVTYNAGSPTCVESLVFDWDKDTEIPLGSAVRFNGTMVVTPNKYRTGDPITNVIQRFDANFPANRDNSVGGLILGEVGTRNVTLSGGVIWSRLSDFTVSAKDSSVDSMISVYFNGTGLTFTSGVTQWDNQNYNDLGTGALVAIGNNKYANLWFFSSIDGSQYGFAYGTDDYNSVGEAANEQVPAYLNQDFFNQSLLLGRFIFQESAATASLIESAFNTLFTTQAINTHNDLGGLQGGVAGEYYHFTAAEHAGLIPWANEAPSDYPLITQTITNGDTTHSPSGDAVFDALATKLDLTGGTMTGNITVGTDIWRITANTADGADTRSIIIDSGVNLNPTRGAYIRVNGNEASSNPGSVLCISGNGADIIFSGGTLRPNADNLYSFGTTTFRWSIVYTHQLYTHGKILFKGIISPTALAANTDNWAPTGYSDCSTIRASASAPVNLTGIQGGEDGKEIKLMNIGANTITLIHDLTSTAANRFLCPNNTSVALRQNGWVTIIYDGTSSRWRVMGA